MSLDKVRNFGIIAHIDAGKTTTTERVLFYTRRIHKVGNVDEGTTTTDWYVVEQQRGISIFSAAVTCEWNGHLFNLIDTPGHVDFTAEVERSLRVLDGAVVVMDGVKGVEAQTETVWRQADRYGIPRLVLVNKMDRPGADYDASLATLRSKLGANPVAVTIPWGSGSTFQGVVDVLRRKALRFEGEKGEEVKAVAVPAELRDAAEAARQATLEAVADYDDALLSQLLDGKEPEEAAIVRALRRAVIAGKVVAAFAGSSLHYQGVQPVLDAVVALLPSPLDRPVVRGLDPETEKPVERDIRKDKSLAALAFKTETDAHGELTYVRVYTGQIRSGDGLYNPRLDKHERTQRLFRMFSHSREAVETAGPGEIVGVVGLKLTATGDTLTEKKAPILLERMAFPEPVVNFAVEPKSSADKDKLDEVLKRLSKDDPTFKVSTDPETGQTILHCMGELHGEILLYRINQDFRTPANIGEPRVAYREAIESVGTADESYTVKVGEKTLFGRVAIEIRPDREAVAPVFEQRLDYESEKQLRRYVAAIKEGLMSAAGSGPVAGYPMTYLRVILTGGQVTTDSADPAYSAAAVQALKVALSKVKTTILEPHMRFEVSAPDEYVGDLLNDLNRRGAEIADMTAEKGEKTIRGNVALAKMFGYASTMRGLTQGRGRYTLEPFEYRAVPAAERAKFGL